MLHLYAKDTTIIMNFAGRLGLTDEEFCEVMISVKMFGMVPVLGHAAELKYEKHLKSQNIVFNKAGNHEHFDYEIGGKRYQVKRFESAGTTIKSEGFEITTTSLKFFAAPLSKAEPPISINSTNSSKFFFSFNFFSNGYKSTITKSILSMLFLIKSILCF